MESCDLIIIGAGPGGYETAIEAAAKGLDVVLFERDKVGGTCLNRGCIPTKALCRSAEVLDTVREAAAFGVNVEGISADFGVAHTRMTEVVSQLRDGVEASLRGVNVVRAEARLTADGTVVADGKEYKAARVVIATGSKPAVLPVPGAELAMTSDDLLALDTLPESICIIGGGVIGMEFASILNSFGVDVTVVEYCKEILPPFDPDIAKRMRTSLSRKGIKFVLSAAVTAIEPGFRVIYSGKKGEAAVECSGVLMAVGRRPVFPAGLEEAGVEYTPRGIKVDALMSTSRPGIFAIGDVNGLCMLAHAATAQGRIVLGEHIDLNVIPSAVFTHPEAAMVGLTPAQIAEKGYHDVKAKSVMYGTSGKAVAMGEPMGVVKMITGKPEDGGRSVILGCSILGAHASDLIQEVATAMANDLGPEAIADTIHAHPTLCELVQNAAK